jgi:hypothetical protein
MVRYTNELIIAYVNYVIINVLRIKFTLEYLFHPIIEAMAM